MATLGTNVLTLTDWAKRRDPDGGVAMIVNLLSQDNEILTDMLWREANMPTSHRTTVLTGLPSAAWRLLNNGIQPSKSTTAQIDEGIGMLEAWGVVDQDLAKLEDSLAEFRLSEAQPHIEAMSQEMASTLIYGNSSTAPEEFTGLAARYSDLSAANAQNIVDAGGVGVDNTSIWLIVWGANTVHGIFPKGSQAGLMHDDYGLETVENAGGIAGAVLRAYRERWQWKAGIALRDWRYVVRIPNIDVSDLVGGAGADLIRFMIKAIHRIKNLSAGKSCFYMNRSIHQYLELKSYTAVKDGGGLTFENVSGRRQSSFQGIPIRIVDALMETEARVV